VAEMINKYYVQTIADNYLRNLSSDSVLGNVHERFLRGLNNEEFTDGFCSLLAIFNNLYTDIAHNPADFGMMFKEIEDINVKTPDYTNSNASFLRVPNLLYVLGLSSTASSDGALKVDCNALLANAKALKITGLPALLEKLRDYGFDISDFGKSPKTGEILSISFTDNRYLTAVLKSMAEALSELTRGDLRNPKNDYFYMMVPALLEFEIVKEPKLTIDTLYNALDEAQRDLAAGLHNLVENDTKYSIRKGQLMRNEWTSTYTTKKSKKVLMSLQVNQDKLSVKLNLNHINQYISIIKDMPEIISNVITTGGWECSGCNPRCSGGFAFEIDGNSYNKCHCGSFVFSVLSVEDIINYESLINKELCFV
jgi:hypothetical protein